MRTIIFLTISLLLIVGCSKKEEAKFEAFSPEAFAYDLGYIWEVNSTVNVRGFQQQTDEEVYSASIGFSVDLETPSGEIINSIFEDTEEKLSGERMLDLQLEAQFDLDSSYASGKYQLHFKIKDNFGGGHTEISVEFELPE
jgi:hypothetical protein